MSSGRPFTPSQAKRPRYRPTTGRLKACELGLADGNAGFGTLGSHPQRLRRHVYRFTRTTCHSRETNPKSVQKFVRQ